MAYQALAQGWGRLPRSRGGEWPSPSDVPAVSSPAAIRPREIRELPSM